MHFHTGRGKPSNELHLEQIASRSTCQLHVRLSP